MNQTPYMAQRGRLESVGFKHESAGKYWRTASIARHEHIITAKVHRSGLVNYEVSRQHSAANGRLAIPIRTQEATTAIEGVQQLGRATKEVLETKLSGAKAYASTSSTSEYGVPTIKLESRDPADEFYQAMMKQLRNMCRRRK